MGVTVEAQLELRTFRDCLDKWERAVSLIRCEIYGLQELPRDQQKLRQVASELGKLCLEADAWGFNELHHIALRTQQLVFDLRTGALPWNSRNVDLVLEGLAVLSGFLPQCEKEFLRRQSTSRMVGSLSRGDIDLKKEACRVEDESTATNRPPSPAIEHTP